MAEQAQTLGSSAQFSSKLIKPKQSTLIIMAIVLLVGERWSHMFEQLKAYL
ncbi:hypothetical protein [Acinetobacter sp. 216872]|uniref:hypothetical protein n=1 Tax=Acinetobacter sp. 216872 TaxID=1310734 RepID=UPI00044B0A01|nr:hypothetical protein [Acinetobacter sp. 216872]EXH78428.1 hypothetical protein J633_0631 [Acinetobacter sp. 216872]